MKEKPQEWSREELKEIYFFNYALENPPETCTTETSYGEKENKTERLYIDANKLAHVRNFRKLKMSSKNN